MWKAEVLGILSQLLHFSVLDKEMEACKKCLIRHVWSPAQNLGLGHTGWDKHNAKHEESQISKI